MHEGCSLVHDSGVGSQKMLTRTSNKSSRGGTGDRHLVAQRPSSGNESSAAGPKNARRCATWPRSAAQIPNEDIANHAPSSCDTQAKEMPILPSLHLDSLASEANQHLARQVARAQGRWSRMLIHPRIISYPTRREQSYFGQIYVDALDRDIVSELWRTKMTGRRNVILAAFNTYTDLTRDMWHAWGIAMIKDRSGSGTHLLIYDCDGFEPEAPMHSLPFPRFLLKSQRQMIHALSKRIPMQQIWVSGDLSRARQNRCYQNTIDWIEAMVMEGDHPFRGEGDSRIAQGLWRSYRPGPV